MKKSLLILSGTIAIFAVVGCMALFNANGSLLTGTEGESEFNAEFILDTEFPDYGGSFTTMGIKNPEVTSGYVKNIGEYLGFEGAPELMDGNTFMMINESGNESRHLMVFNASGAVWYAIPSKVFPDAEGQPSLPSEKEAIEIAELFLSKNSLLPADATLDKVVADKQYTKKKDTHEIISERIVMYQVMNSGRQVNGIPVEGPGNKLKVYIGGNEEILGFYKAWPELVPSGNVSVKSVEDAYHELKNGVQKFSTQDVSGKKVFVKNVYIAYWVEPAVDKHDYALPVYVFEGEVELSDSVKVPYKAYVVASTDDMES